MTLTRFMMILVALSLAIVRPTSVFAHAIDAPLAQTDGLAEDARPQVLKGTIHALVIDDPIRGTSSRHLELELADGTLVSLGGAGIDGLARGAHATVSGRYRGKSFDVTSLDAVAPADSVPKADAEIDGTLAILHADDFANGKSEFVFELHQSNGKISRLRLGSLPSALAPGMRLRVTGHAETDGESVTPDHISVLADPASAGEPGGSTVKAATANSVLVIMANFNNTAPPAFTPAQAQQVMTGNSDSVGNFFREASYGQQLMNVTVTPSWLTMNLARPASCGTTDWQNIGNAADAAARTRGSAYDPAAYKFVVYLFPKVAACGWLGLAYINSPHKAWMNGVEAFFTSAIAHEMGHNFGLLHAASVRCGSGVIGGSCTVSEYGDPFDTMGNQRAMHYNAMQKAKLGWIPPTSVQTYGGGSATYTLAPLEVAGAGTYAVKIPTGSSNRTYWLEFRQPIGFDSPLAAFPNNGAQIRVAYPFETLCAGCGNLSDDTELLDTTPTTSAFTDATLTAGSTFRDPTYGINITVLSASASAMTVQVSNGASPTPAPTTTTIASSMNPAVVGSGVTFTASVTGNAPTGTVQFTADGATLCGAVTLSSNRATCATSSLPAGTHAIAARYSGNSTNAASTSATLSEVVNAAPGGSMNVALAVNGGVASASSTYSTAYPVAAINDNRRTGAPWDAGGGWNDGTVNAYPDWVQVTFTGAKTIDHVVVYTLQDNYASPVEPTDTMTFTRYGITAFTVQAWNGSSWVTLGSVSNNNLVKRTIRFSPYTTDRIRLTVNGALASWSRVIELEAWTASTTTSATGTNYALAANGGVPSASSAYSAAYPATAINDGDQIGGRWGAGGGWNDGTAGVYPDWVQVTFNGTKTIDRVVVYTLQDNYTQGLQPSDTMTFSRYGITGFQVQAWNGSSWVTLGTVSGNNLVKRTVSFSPFATDRIRVSVTGSLATWSRIVEVQAWGG